MSAQAVATGFVLAGGGSNRMGRDKGLLELAGVPLIVRVSKLLSLVTGAPTQVIGNNASYASLGLSVVKDDWPNAGPLGGITTALRRSNLPWAMIVACDLPYLTGEWLEFLLQRAQSSEADVVLPMNLRGPEPLCAMYHTRCEPFLRSVLDRGTRKVTDGLASLGIDRIEREEWARFDPEGWLFKNMNSPADYDEAKARLG